MPYATYAHNPTTGQVIPASWGDDVVANTNYLASTRPHCRATRSANVAIAHNTWSSIPFTVESYDVGGCHSTASDQSRFVVPSGEGGKYMACAQAVWATNGTGRRLFRIFKNNATILAQVELPLSSSESGGTVAFPAPVVLAAADYVELQVFQTSGGLLDILFAADYSPVFGFWWVATT